MFRFARPALKLAGHAASPETALASLRRIQRHSVSIKGGEPQTGISIINHDQSEVIAALKLKKPSPEPK